MKASALLLTSFVLASIFIYSCSRSNDPGVIIEGKIIDSELRTPILNSLVQVTSPQEFNSIFSRTDSIGTYSLNIPDITAVTDITLSASAPDFSEESRSLKVAENDEVSNFDFELVSEFDDGTPVPSGPSNGAASIELVSISNETINIAATGGITSSTFTFVVKDSSGNSIDLNNQIDVEFSITSGPGGGEVITPTTAETNASGQVVATLQSGNIAGVVKIEAKIERTVPKSVQPKIIEEIRSVDIPRTDLNLSGSELINQSTPRQTQASNRSNNKSMPEIIITSSPVAITIHGGFPDLNHFTLESLTDTNIEGFDRNGVEITFKVRVGDEFSNPVVPGTAVYFSTTGGLIQGSSTQNTDNDGYAEVKLFAGEPRPVNGRGVVTAATIDKNNTEISQTEEFVFSTSKALITPELTTLQLAEFETQRINYTVTDENENPMAARTRIQVSAENKMELSGELEYILTNELNPGTDITEFSFVATAPEGFKDSEIITIKVTSPAGIVTTNKELTISGTGVGVAGKPSGAAIILLENLTENTINIIETGGTVNSAFTFQVQDSSGRALNLDNPVEVEFEIIQGPGGGEAIIPTSAFTNSTGRVTSSIISGNIAGVVRIQAKVERPDIGLTILSKPVAITIHGGFPDLDHFSITPSNDPELCQESANSYNFEGFNINGLKNCIVVIVGDKFSNPVKPGTAVYFSTTGGIIEGSAVEHTDDLGRASVTVLSANPRPADGKFVITARTINENNVFIDQSANMIFSTSQVQISANPTTFDLPPNGGATFTYTVEDLNGNPMASGTTIEVLAGDDMEVTGDANVTLGDYLRPGSGATEFTFSIRDTDSEVDDPADLSIQIVVTTPSGRVTSLTPISGTRKKAIK